MTVEMYCDGSCLDNGFPAARGGWSFLIIDGGKVIESHFGKIRKGRQTCNRAEMEAFLQALIWIDSQPNKDDVIYNIYCDSHVVVKGVNGSAKRADNRDIWEQIETLCAKLLGKIHVEYCEGHVEEFNILADKLAKQGANSLIKVPVEVAI